MYSRKTSHGREQGADRSRKFCGSAFIKIAPGKVDLPKSRILAGVPSVSRPRTSESKEDSAVRGDSRSVDITGRALSIQIS